MIRVQHRPPDRPSDRLAVVGFARDLDHLVVALERRASPRACDTGSGSPGSISSRTMSLQSRLRVGEAPRDVRVAADDERRHARQGHADQPMRSSAFGPSCHSSDARYQVFGTRTVRCMSLATSARPSASGAGHRPVVAADGAVSINSRLPTPCPSVRRRHRPTADASARVERLVLDRAIGRRSSGVRVGLGSRRRLPVRRARRS